jgi:DNA-binding PadR family transcriptional regulator
MFRLLRDLYRIWPGTLYPLLHGMEERGWLKSNVLSASDETDACIRSRQRE